MDSNINSTLRHNIGVGRGVDPTINITGTTVKAAEEKAAAGHWLARALENPIDAI
jgi:hypothetical protein